jgi:hypothetical protein
MLRRRPPGGASLKLGEGRQHGIAGGTERVPHAGRERGHEGLSQQHSGLTHLGEAGASLLMLTAKSRHKKPENVRRYFHSSPEAIAEVTSLLAPGNARR